MLSFALGESIPPDTAHAVSVSLPTWRSNIGYEEGEDWVLSKMVTGYPRFYIHKSIQAFARDIVAKYGTPGQQAVLFPTKRIASRCLDFIRSRAPPSALTCLGELHLALDPESPSSSILRSLSPTISAVTFSPEAFPYAKQYWQHSGDGVSSRRAEFCHGLFKEGILVLAQPPESSPFTQNPRKGPRRYQRPLSLDGTMSPAPSPRCPGPQQGDGDANAAVEAQEFSHFLEERFGRNLDISFVEPAKSAIRRRIAGALKGGGDLDPAAAVTPDPAPELGPNTRGVANLKEDDVFLYPCGMNAIFNAHRALLAARGAMKSVNFGFPYVDTLKILQKFGPGCVLYGHASDADLDDLEQRLQGGERFLGLFCEFPGNPLLTCPDLARIRRLADQYDFAVVVDETIGTFANVNVLGWADVVVSSLTKIFSGDCNVMGGSAIANPAGRYYGPLKAALAAEYDDAAAYWAEDVIFMERNSRDFASRVDRINANADALSSLLAASPLVRDVYYPKLNPTSRPYYDACRIPGGGYGGLLSVTFRHPARAVAFYDAVPTAKGPSLGTNFTLTSPYVLLAHYQELDWARDLGVDPDLLRISVGLEDTDQLTAAFRNALKVAEEKAI